MTRPNGFRMIRGEEALRMGYSTDKRKRRRQHRAAARRLLGSGGIFNGFSRRGSTFHSVAAWQLWSARNWGR